MTKTELIERLLKLKAELTEKASKTGDINVVFTVDEILEWVTQLEQ